MLEQSLMDRFELGGGPADPVRQLRAIQLDPLAGVDLALAVERQAVGVFADQDVGYYASVSSRRRSASWVLLPGLPRARRDLFAPRVLGQRAAIDTRRDAFSVASVFSSCTSGSASACPMSSRASWS
jgi:hypothetical protein